MCWIFGVLTIRYRPLSKQLNSGGIGHHDQAQNARPTEMRPSSQSCSKPLLRCSRHGNYNLAMLIIALRKLADRLAAR